MKRYKARFDQSLRSCSELMRNAVQSKNKNSIWPKAHNADSNTQRIMISGRIWIKTKYLQRKRSKHSGVLRARMRWWMDITLRIRWIECSTRIRMHSCCRLVICWCVRAIVQIAPLGINKSIGCITCQIRIDERIRWRRNEVRSWI